MAKITSKAKVDVVIQFTIDEDEARALDALVGYGIDEFIKSFYEKLGKSYMEKHEGGLRRFMTGIKENIPGVLGRLDKAHKAFNTND